MDNLKRGDLITILLQGELGKPRPALVVQADVFDGLSSVTILPITSTRVETPLLRVDVGPTSENGLTHNSQVMVDKVQTPSTRRVGGIIGRLDRATMIAVDRALAVFLGLA